MSEPMFDIDEVLTPEQLEGKLREYTTGFIAYSASAPKKDVFYDDVLPFEIPSRTGPPPWAVGFSKQFKKDTSAIDRKIMGRILEVLEELSDFDLPFEVRGDTFKPLKGSLEGCWRYRIGDYRLVIHPQENKQRIDAVAFGARGSIYD